MSDKIYELKEKIRNHILKIHDGVDNEYKFKMFTEVLIPYISSTDCNDLKKEIEELEFGLFIANVLNETGLYEFEPNDNVYLDDISGNYKFKKPVEPVEKEVSEEDITDETSTTLNLYKIRKKHGDDSNYSYKGFVVAAKTKAAARLIHPHDYNGEYLNGEWNTCKDSKFYTDSWYPFDITIEFLGVAKDGTKPGIICSK